MLYYKFHDGDEADFWIIVIAGLFVLFAVLIMALSLVNPILNNPHTTEKDPKSTYTVISSDGIKYSNLTKRFHNDSHFTTEQGKTIVFTGNHTTIEE
jgi:hypothetical protein